MSIYLFSNGKSDEEVFLKNGLTSGTFSIQSRGLFIHDTMIGKFKKRKRLRIHGFLARTSTVDGKKVLRARRRKGRHSLAVSYPNRFKAIRGKSRHHNIAGGTARVVTYPGIAERFRVR